MAAASAVVLLPPCANASPAAVSVDAQRGGGMRSRRTLISLTPLIDVVFILLVFFMLASSFSERRVLHVDVAAPRGAGGERSVTVITVGSRGALLRDGEPVRLQELAASIARAPGVAAEGAWLLRPGPESTVEDLVAVIDGLADAGLTRLSLTR